MRECGGDDGGGAAGVGEGERKRVLSRLHPKCRGGAGEGGN